MNKTIMGLLLAAAGAAQAGELALSGFSTVTAGKAIDGYDGDFLGFQCPCFIGNYEHGATYQKREWSLIKESLLGVQGQYRFDPRLSATVQVVARASENGKPEVDWAYLSYDIGASTTLQLGRRRLPIYAYSDSVYIGYTLPWVRVPQDIYGWEVGAYNGANLTHTTSLGDWALTANIFGGQETTRDNIEQRKIYYGYRVDDAWKHIIGSYLDLSNEVFGVRLMYMQNAIDLHFFPPDDAPSAQLGTRQRILGLAASMDYRNWMVRTEANTFSRPALDFKSSSWSATVGYRWGSITPLVGYSSYKERLTAGYTQPQIDNTRFAAVRWDFRRNMDLKLQFDSVIDHSAYSFTNNAKMVSLSFDALY